ncbi:LacI family DNA-binding transcriptional regulator [Caballeronia sp. LjRoot29]|uniref:LacI family DNA-binding transcriptional regulator n=1 Tax=Caballeronia sp. LjRoot29 TaxID=3342315 RepID=UPI003ECC783E
MSKRLKSPEKINATTSSVGENLTVPAKESSASESPELTRISLMDVAKRARVSTATVSRVLNNPESVRENKREAVKRACEELGYVVNGAARALSSKRSNTIGAVVPTLDTQTFSRSLDAFQRRLKEAGYTLLLSSSGFDSTVELDAVTTLLEHGIDALMIVGHTHDPRMWERIDRQRVPCVQILTLDTRHPSIGYDNVAVGHLIADHLVQLGHNQLGVIVGTPPTNDRVSNRIVGIRKRLAGSGLTLPPSRVIGDAFTLADGCQAALRLLNAQGGGPTAIICGNDQLAFGVLMAAASKGLRVPEDLSVIGFNNYDFAASLSPPLTTVNVNLIQLGQQSADYLLSQLQQGRPSASTARIETALIVRSSTGPAPKVAGRWRAKQAD